MAATVKKSVILYVLFIIILNQSCKKDEVPTLTTETVTNITGTTAKSGGTIISEGSGTIISRGVCWSKNIDPSVLDSKTENGAGAGTFISEITGLNGGSTYYLKAYATNQYGTGYGMAMSFTTLGQKPSASTLPATNVMAHSCTFNGSTNPQYLSTIVSFEYGNTTNYSQTIIATQSPATGTSQIQVNVNVSSLSPRTLYHYRIKCENSLGVTYGEDVSFTTPGNPPSLISEIAAPVSPYNATLNGRVNPNDLSTVVIFDYGLTQSYGMTVTANESPLTGNQLKFVHGNITSLNPNTLYHFRLKATNELGTVTGDDMTFTTLGQTPTATILPATNIYPTSATLNGSVSANYLLSTIVFEYGLTTQYGNTLQAIQSPLNGGQSTNVSVDITGLSLGTIYHYRIRAENELGVTYTPDCTFMASYTIGALYEGGYIFYIDPSGYHGLIAARDDMTEYVGGEYVLTTWNNGTFVTTNATNTVIGSGQSNTNLIVSAQGSGYYAAKLCLNYDRYGFDDWFLPSKDELFLIYQLRDKIPSLNFNFSYWSSTEYDNDEAWYQQFKGTDPQKHGTKAYPNLRIRPVRAF